MSRAKILAGQFSEYKESFGCAVCGFNAYGGALQFHHVRPDEKEFCITSQNYTTDKGAAEINKCILLCANCHAMVHGHIILDEKILELHRQSNYNLR